MEDFDYIPFSYSSAAPELPDYREPVQHKKKQPVKQVKKKSALNPEAERKLKTILAVVIVAVAALTMLSLIKYVDNNITANNKKINELNIEIEQAKAESVRLNAALGAVASADKVQEYAVNILGMQKAERYQIHYFETKGQDRVIVAGGKDVTQEKKDNK